MPIVADILDGHLDAYSLLLPIVRARTFVLCPLFCLKAGHAAFHTVRPRFLRVQARTRARTHACADKQRVQAAMRQ